MKSRTTERFRRKLASLPAEVRELARRAYRRFQADPSHPGLRFRQVHETLPVYSARVGLHYRAVCTVDDDEAVWFWIGSHAEYDALLDRL